MWDRVWDGPAIVTMLEVAGGETKRYRVAEIDQWRRLGRTAWRRRDQLCRYVRVLLPEDEAIAVVTHTPEHPAERVPLLMAAGNRITKQLEKRGVDVPG